MKRQDQTREREKVTKKCARYTFFFCPSFLYIFYTFIILVLCEKPMCCRCRQRPYRNVVYTLTSSQMMAIAATRRVMMRNSGAVLMCAPETTLYFRQNLYRKTVFYKKPTTNWRYIRTCVYVVSLQARTYLCVQ